MRLVRTPRMRLWGYYGYPRVYARQAWPQPAVRRETWNAEFVVEGDPERLTIKAELPEVKPEQIDVTVNDGIVTVKVEQQREREIDREGYQWREYSRTGFSRSIPLPENAEWSGTAASFEEGILTVTVPLQPIEKPKPQRIEIRHVGGEQAVTAEAEPASPAADSPTEEQKAAKEGKSEETA